MGETEDRQDEVQYWTAKRRVTVVLEISKGKTTITEAAWTHGSRGRMLEGTISGRSGERPEKPPHWQKDELTKRLERKVGRMALEIDILREATKP